MRCAQRFKNWNSVVGQYVRPSSFVESSIATGRENFEIQLWEPSDVQTVWAVFCNCNYQVPEAPAVVLDLGANIGTFSIYAAKVKRARRIIALEPVADTFAKLHKNIAANGLDSVVTCVQQGIGAAPGTRTIYQGTSSPHSSMYFEAILSLSQGKPRRSRSLLCRRSWRSLICRASMYAKRTAKGARSKPSWRPATRFCVKSGSSPWSTISQATSPTSRHFLAGWNARDLSSPGTPTSEKWPHLSGSNRSALQELPLASPAHT